MSQSIHEDDRSPQEKRRRSVDQRLRAALDRLVAGKPHTKSLRKSGYRLTVTVLAREAGVSRNTIYANHRSFVDEMARKAGRPDKTPDRMYERDAREARSVIAELRGNLRDLATQNAALLHRALDAEHRAEHLAKRNASLAAEIAALRMPVVMVREE